MPTIHPPKRRKSAASSRSVLKEYNRKRDFTKTAEPPPRISKIQKELIFVIQEHHATRLHWDFRLEAQGVLKSWAVTKEPTMDPAVKRLAVRVEDHPFEYAKFHGDIPEGQYGAGSVAIWDHGTYEPKGNLLAGLSSGKVEVNLHGQKLKGMFALVRMGGPGKKENWLLIKMKDEFAKPDSAPADKPKKTKPARKPVAAPAKSQRVDFTHVDKMMFPESKVTKADLIRFYLEIAGHLLPHLKDRPCTLERLPDGLARPDAPRFWQKNTPSYYPDWIPRWGKEVQYVLVNDENILAYLVNQGATTFHPFMSRVKTIEHPDYVLFDLDPGEAGFSAAVKIARKLHELLGEEDVDSFVKTSGKSGLHVLTAWSQAGGYDEARAWASKIADELVKALPEIATTQRSKDKRNGRVYVDIMQNGLGKHAVPPYVVRATPLATVSTPLDWDELTPKLDPRKFTMAFVLKRVKKIDPILPLLSAWNSAG
jgi:bifunctional non-homologous end joining protein LigD